MKDYRPGYHYRPRENWINDPCGLIHHQGVYHLYHQYNPHGDLWGDMHWGHAVSSDMVNWKEQEIAMKPDEANGEEHCFTGCGYHLPDGRAAFYYTSIELKRDPEQWIAYPQDDALSAITQTREGAMTIPMHKPEMEVSEWRDPSILPYKDGYLMVLGCRLSVNGDEHTGAALLYTSKDGVHFTYHSILARGDGSDERSWECPNFFKIGDKHVLMYSPYRQPLYIVGTLTEDLRFIPEGRGTADESGQEGWYAPQSFRDEHGRQLIIGWMTERSRGTWDGIKGWAGCMSLPREVYLENTVFKMRVIPEVEKLVASTEEGELPMKACTAGEQFRVIIDAELEADGCVACEVLATPDGEEKTVVTLHGDGRLVLNRGASSKYPTHHSILERRISMQGGKAHLEIYVDHSVIEIAGNGEWISSRVYPSREDALEAAFCVRGGKGHYALSQMNNCEK